MKTLPEQIDHFLDLHKEGFRPIVVVSSGGTIVPLTNSGSPFIDNFSLGERGANSVEYFLANGYVVIFLYRSESRFPFTKNIFNHFSDRINDKLLTKIIHTDEDETTGSHTLSLQQSQLSTVQKELVQLEGKILRNVTKYRYFLPVAFRGIEEYLHLLEHLGKSLAYFGPRACFYLAAAVSDFYIPSDQLPSQDSFESRTEEEIVLALSQVPKRLGALTQDWAPNAYVVSFKLETDENILLDKARRAIDKYSVHLVVANLLHQRRDACILVAGKGVLQGSAVTDVTDERFEYEHITRDATHELYIEKQLIENIVGKHKAFIFHKYTAKYFTDVTPTTDTDSNKTEDSTKRPRDDALVMELVNKIFEQQSSLICKQVRYYLTHTNSKEDEFQATSLAFTPPSKKNQSRVDEVVVVRKEYERRVFPLISGVVVMAAVVAIKVYCNLNDVQ